MECSAGAARATRGAASGTAAALSSRRLTIERNRETQFDPEIVEAMVRVVNGRLADPSTIKISEPWPYVSITNCR
jgi:response regulator RpfG family c-di-GMP phosphodiesterase